MFTTRDFSANSYTLTTIIKVKRTSWFFYEFNFFSRLFLLYSDLNLPFESCFLLCYHWPFIKLGNCEERNVFFSSSLRFQSHCQANSMTYLNLLPSYVARMLSPSMNRQESDDFNVICTHPYLIMAYECKWTRLRVSLSIVYESCFGQRRRRRKKRKISLKHEKTKSKRASQKVILRKQHFVHPWQETQNQFSSLMISFLDRARL